MKTIAQGPNADLLMKFIDLLYEGEMQEPEYFSPEDLAARKEPFFNPDSPKIRNYALDKSDKLIYIEDYDKHRTSRTALSG